MSAPDHLTPAHGPSRVPGMRRTDAHMDLTPYIDALRASVPPLSGPQEADGGRGGSGDSDAAQGHAALADVLYDLGHTNGHAAAERILADPGPLLAALAEAGVLREAERLATRMVYDADGGPTDRVIITECRYVTEWVSDA